MKLVSLTMNAVTKLCKSGLMENNHCYETAYPEGKEKKEIACTKKSDCSYIMIKGDTNSTKEADCKCTKIGEQYCEYPSLSEE